jgi:hypothetical protein
MLVVTFIVPHSSPMHSVCKLQTSQEPTHNLMDDLLFTLTKEIDSSQNLFLLKNGNKKCLNY